MARVTGGRIDLHIHTTASDGSLTPSEVVERAAGRGLAAIAVTDHDHLLNENEAEHLSRKYGFTILPGIEISADGICAHILALN